MRDVNFKEYVKGDLDPSNIHVYLEQINYDRKTGKKLSRGTVTTYNKTQWGKARGFLKSLGYEVVLVAAPKDMKREELTVAGQEDKITFEFLEGPKEEEFKKVSPGPKK